LTPKDFIYPLFVRHGVDIKEEIASMPGQFQWSVDQLAAEAKSIAELEIPAVILFGIPEEKDPIGLDNFSPQGIIQQATRAIKAAVPEMVVITDVCLCEYTDHGHCGVLNLGDDQKSQLPEGYVLNDPTLEILGKVALSHVDAGADIVNCSWGGAGNPSYFEREVIDYAREQGVVLVAAAGNNGWNTEFYPAAYPHVLAVANLDNSDQKIASSNFGTWVDVSAQGTNIHSTYRNGTYLDLNGTSMASPHVAAVCALVKTKWPSFSAEQVRHVPVFLDQPAVAMPCLAVRSLLVAVPVRRDAAGQRAIRMVEAEVHRPPLRQ